jgi:hypothetical protein
MRDFSISKEINASPDHIWSILADVRRWPEWTASISEIHPLKVTPLGVGSRVRVLQPRLRPAIMTITEWEPGRGFVWIAKSPVLTAIAGHQLTPTSSGCTVTLTVAYRGPLSVFAAIFARRLTKHYIELEATGLKARSEGRR